ncbi:MAG: exodeoxyribonuclease VII large subunit [Syntrophus sp. (in: bacteria)]|nr:exodeoxyribonuclease VII large subunit [Syntrophus sp. (in: bacteria)]
MSYPLSSWQIRIYSVSELSAQIRQSVNSQFRDILVEGEISNFKPYPSGHVYFTLKDDLATIKAVVFNYTGKYPEGALKDGVAVICKGRVDVYEKRGEYRLLVDALEVKGIGLLQMKFQALKEKLLKEGLFAPEKKKPLPFLPERIGIVTSPGGAAIQDMIKIIFGKFENMCVTVYPVKVQGDDACYEIAEGIDYFNRTKEVDIIITGRGGGSLEDLAPFNEEVVARAIFRSEIPVVSAVGHEIDFTIADFAADVRAPTPTAAADIVVKDKRDLINLLSDVRLRLEQCMNKRLERSKLLLFQEVVALKEQKDFIVDYRIYVDELANNLIHGFSSYFKEMRGQADTLAQRLKDLNPDNILRRGYSITVKKGTMEVVTSADQVIQKEELFVRLHKGELLVSVLETSPEN